MQVYHHECHDVTLRLALEKGTELYSIISSAYGMMWIYCILEKSNCYQALKEVLAENA